MIVTVDTGGTKTLVASFNSKGEAGEKFRFPTPENQSEYIQTLLGILRENYKAAEVDAIVIAIPGTIKGNVVQWCGNLPWRNFDVADDIKKYYPCPIWLENDAKLAGLSEANMMETVPELCLYVTISTGIGSGIILSGKLLPELTRSEAGHMVLEYDGALRPWQTFASGKAIHTIYGKYAYEIDDAKVWDRIADTFARGFATLIPTLQPDVIVIGGSIGTHFDKYKDTLVRIVDDMLPECMIRPVFIKAAHPEEAVIYGGYYYAVHRLSN